MVRIGAIVMNVKDARRASRFWGQVFCVINTGGE